MVSKKAKLFKAVYCLLIALIGVSGFLLVFSLLPIKGNIKFMIIQSGSMKPSIKTGDMVIVKPAKEYMVGDIISFGKANALTTHRIYDIKNTGNRNSYFTKGDFNNAPDQKAVFKENISGKVLINIPYLGYVIHFIKKPLGFIFVIAATAGIIIFDQGRKIHEEVKKRKTN